MQSIRSIVVFNPLIWGVAALQAAALAAWIAISPRFSLSFVSIHDPWWIVSVCLLITVVLSWNETVRPLPVFLARLRTAAMGLVFMLFAFISIRFLNHLVMSIPMPLADDFLHAWDRMLGFDWAAYATWLSNYAEWMPYVRITYSSTPQAAALLFAALVMAGKTERAKEFGTLLFLSALFVVLTGWILPANGAWVRHGDASLTEIYGTGAGTFFVKALAAVRGAGSIVLSFENLPGLVSFPSFHTVTGLLIIYACRDSIYTLVPASLWSGVMLILTPVYGGHYMIDIVAGAIVTAVMILCSVKVGAFTARFTESASPAR